MSKGYVRGDLQMQAFHIQPTEDGGTDLTFGALMDPMVRRASPIQRKGSILSQWILPSLLAEQGSIPKWVVNKASGQQVNITLKMRDLFESMTS